MSSESERKVVELIYSKSLFPIFKIKFQFLGMSQNLEMEIRKASLCICRLHTMHLNRKGKKILRNQLAKWDDQKWLELYVIKKWHNSAKENIVTSNSLPSTDNPTPNDSNYTYTKSTNLSWEYLVLIAGVYGIKTKEGGSKL